MSQFTVEQVTDPAGPPCPKCGVGLMLPENQCVNVSTCDEFLRVRAECKLCPHCRWPESDHLDPQHPKTEDCPDAECGQCAIRDCPHGESLHYHHDGCPACFYDPAELSA